MEQLSLFDNAIIQPLAARMRPQNIEEYIGQTHLLGKGKILRNMVESDTVSSMIFWGPPGVGKTTLAQIIANKTKANFLEFSAVTSGIKEIKQVMEQADRNRSFGEKTILFVDEIHRFNKAQQDAFLPFVEKGTIILIGATTENPSFEINAALLSRCRVFVLKALEKEDIITLLKRTMESPKGFGNQDILIEDREIESIAIFANGDARAALSLLEMVVLNGEITEDAKLHISAAIVEECTGKKMLMYDKNGEEHYNIISALHKSMRNSDPDAAIYWLARMLEAGEAPLYIARRIVRFASEDIGMADSNALTVAVAAYQACHFIGMPECSVNLTHAVTYMSMAPKSNAMEVAYLRVKEDAHSSLTEPVPMHIRNAPTKLMKEIGYGKGYEYAHDMKDKLSAMDCLPESLAGREYYIPTEEGLEAGYKERLQKIKEWKREHRGDKQD